MVTIFNNIKGFKTYIFILLFLPITSLSLLPSMYQITCSDFFGKETLHFEDNKVPFLTFGNHLLNIICKVF